MTVPSKWLTKEKDLEVAKNIIEEYIQSQDSRLLGVLEVVVNHEKEMPDIHLAEWVMTLTDYYQEKYGVKQGNFVVNMVIGDFMTHGNTIH